MGFDPTFLSNMFVENVVEFVVESVVEYFVENVVELFVDLFEDLFVEFVVDFVVGFCCRNCCRKAFEHFAKKMSNVSSGILSMFIDFVMLWDKCSSRPFLCLASLLPSSPSSIYLTPPRSSPNRFKNGHVLKALYIVSGSRLFCIAAAQANLYSAARERTNTPYYGGLLRQLSFCWSNCSIACSIRSYLF